MDLRRESIATPGMKRARHRLVRWLVLAAMVAYQGIAALHAATDRGHLVGGSLVEAAVHAAHAHEHAGDEGNSHSHGGLADHACDFCVLAGPAVPMLARAPVLVAPIRERAVEIAFMDAGAARLWLHVGHPIRAPPLLG